MTKTLVKGAWYTVTTASGCTITDANGNTLGTAEAGKQFPFQATTELITFSDPAATVLVNPNHAPVATGNSSGGASTPPTLYPVAPALQSYHTPPVVHDLGGLAVGSGARGDGYESSVFGEYASGSGEKTVAVGRAAEAIGFASTAMGWQAKAVGENSIAVGDNAITEGENAVAVGWEAQAPGIGGVAVGPMAAAVSGAVAVGVEASAQGAGSVAIGPWAQAQGTGMMFAYGDITLGVDGYAADGEVHFTGAYPVSKGFELQQVSFVPAEGDTAQAFLDGKAGIMFLRVVMDYYGNILEYKLRGATWEELLPRDLMSAAAATPATMSLEDEPAPPNIVQRFMQTVAKIQARKQAEAAANS